MSAIIGTATVTIKKAEKGPELFHSTISLVANPSNWRKVAKDLIGDEPVTYSELSAKDTLRRFPVIKISSESKEAIARVQTKAANVE